MYRILKLKFGGLLIIFIALVLSITVASVPPKAEAGSSHYYYYFKEKQELGVDTNRIAVLERAKVRATNRFEAFGIADEDIEAHALQGWSLTKVPAGMRTVEEVSQLVGQMSAAEAADFISPVFTDAKGGPVIIVPDILMRFNEGVSSEEAEAILTEADVGTIAEKDWAGMSGAYRIRTASRDGFEVLAAANRLAEREEVKYASPDMIVTGRTEYIPSDPLFPQCWGIHNTGQSGGTVDIDMDGPEAWDITTGDPCVIVVILDCGVEQSHPDIHQRPGYDFTGAGGGGGPVNSYDNHGTAVAGCVSAMINGLGVVGIAPNCKIASARVHTTTSSSGSFSFYISHVVNGIEWAVTIGARITNNSNSYSGTYSAITNKYQDTYQNHEIIHFAAAGNYSSSSITYPANLSTVNAVAAIDRDGSLASFSNYGSGLAFSAPGVEINTTDRTGSSGYDAGDYHVGDGTSYASPYAAGVAALLLSCQPSLSAEEVEQRIQGNCFDLGTAGYDTTFGWGLVNAYFNYFDVKPLASHTKWSQPPVEVDPNSDRPIYCGWDEESFRLQGGNGYFVADDFRCLGTMPVTSIHWWGSYVDWDGCELPEPGPISWRIGFWSDVPAGIDANYSHPQELLWQIEVPADRVDVNIVGQDYFPEIPYVDTCFQYYLDLNEEEYFWQSKFEPNTTDNIFWLSIAAVYPEGAVDYPWGWKTRPWHWMDDAVMFTLTTDPEPGIVLDPYDVTPIKDPVFEESYDVSFELNTEPNWIKWEQLYTGIRHWPHYEDEKSMDVNDDWFLENTFQVSGITRLDGLAFDDSNGTLFGVNPQYTDTLYEFTTSGYLIDSRSLGFVSSSSALAYNSNTGNLFLGDSGSQRIYEITTSGVQVGFFASPGLNPHGMAYNSPADTLFVYSAYTNIIYEVDPNDGSVLKSFGAPGGMVRGLAFDGINLLAYEVSQQRIYLLNPANGAVRDSFDVAIPSGDTGLACDGTRIYAWNNSSDRVHVYYAPVTSTRLVADDWQCLRQTPIMAISWWGSYIGYGYEACSYGPFMPLPVPPDRFSLKIWTDVPADDPCNTYGYSHPNEVIWEYVTEEYDEVLVGYDKHPHGEPNEPVFRYSVRLPKDEWFMQPDVNGVFWLSVQAVYDTNTPNYDWGWTNHEHVFNDSAVSGYYDDVNEVWGWEELYDQNEASEDMSFMLFTEPECVDRTSPFYNDWITWNKPDCWCYERNCRGDADGLLMGPYWVGGPDLNLFKSAYMKTNAVLQTIPNGICCDFDHLPMGPYRVGGPDLNTFKLYYMKPAALVPPCPMDWDGDTDDDYNFWTN